MHKIHVLMLSALMLGLSLVTVSSGLAHDESDEDGGSWSIPLAVLAPVMDAEGNQLGLVAWGGEESDEGMMLLVQGLAEGEHGIHLHETGNCDPSGEKAFEKAGGHFNPGGVTHPDHAGDLGNLTVGANGIVAFAFDSSSLTFDDSEFGVADADGTALVIHADPDDLATDPSGNSGARIACAVIAAAA